MSSAVDSQHPHRDDAEEADRLIWEALQRLFRKDLLEMEKQSTISQRGVAAPQRHTSIARAEKTTPCKTDVPLLRPSTSDRCSPSLVTSSVSSVPVKCHDGRRLRQRTCCFYVIASLCLSWALLSTIVLPLAIWGNNYFYGTNVVYVHPLQESLSLLREVGAYYDPLFVFSSKGAPRVDEHASIGGHRHRHAPPPSSGRNDLRRSHPVFQQTFYAKDSAWHTLRNDKLPLVTSDTVPGRPPPLVWLQRCYIQLCAVTVENPSDVAFNDSSTQKRSATTNRGVIHWQKMGPLAS